MPGEHESLRAEVARLARVERRMELLLAVTGEFAAARTSEQIARIAIDKGLEAVGAAYGGLWAIDHEQQVLRLLEVSEPHRGRAHPWSVVPLDLDAPLPLVARTGEAVYVESLADYQARFPASLERIRGTISSPELAYALVPVAADGPPIAALALTYERASELDVGERTFLTILARQCGLALNRVRLTDALTRAYAVEREAHLEAEEATRAREDILSVVSHDLRNPLGTILMGASTLLAASDAQDPKHQRTRLIAERIHRQSERMARLIGDLVDFAGIQAGKLAIQRSRHAPEAILASAAELLGPAVRERGLSFDVHSTQWLPELDCDGERAVQVFSNLVTNALKVTPKNGRVGIGARTHGETVAFYVRDTGVGIHEDEVPHLFTRYWRSKQAPYRGTGLGLSVAKGIVDSHGGRIWAESTVGAGSTFWFTLG